MINSIKNFLNSFVTKKTTPPNEYNFTFIGEVLIIQIPTGKMPPTKAAEYVEKIIETFSELKDELGVSHILGLAKSE